MPEHYEYDVGESVLFEGKERCVTGYFSPIGVILDGGTKCSIWNLKRITNQSCNPQVIKNTTMEVANIVRVFEYTKDGKKNTLDDPNPQMSVAEVLKYYASTGQFPELANGATQGPEIKKDKAVYSITHTAGKLG